MNDAQAHRILSYIGDAVETCEKDTNDILGVMLELEISDVKYQYEWSGERFVLNP